MSKKKKDLNKDGENDHQDAKIAGMKKSGMSDKEIKEKYPKLYEDVESFVMSLLEKKSQKMPSGYKAAKGTKRGDKLRALTKRYKEAETEAEKRKAREARDKYEQSIASKPGYKSRKSKYSEASFAGEELLREFVRSALRKKKRG
jgi:hypothetical protein